MASLITKVQLVTVLLHLSLAVLTVQAEDEEETDLDKRIFGGRDCKPGEAPFHVVLKDYDTNNNYEFCGGSVIHEDWVITADHCHKSSNTLKAEIDGTEVEITNMVPFPDSSNRHDILLLKLPTPTKQTPIPLPPVNNCAPPALRKEVMMVGKRLTTYDPTTLIKDCSTSKKLLCATTDAVDCLNRSQNFDGHFYPSMICTHRTGVDICHGDSGGAVVYNNMLYGVMVRAGDELNDWSVASMDICYYRKWIEDVAKV